jgi:hypothetical protein
MLIFDNSNVIRITGARLSCERMPVYVPAGSLAEDPANECQSRKRHKEIYSFLIKTTFHKIASAGSSARDPAETKIFTYTDARRITLKGMRLCSFE